jgi:hypothetical protein
MSSHKEEDLIADSQALVGEEGTVHAAGIFGLQDNYKAIAVGGAVTGVALPDTPGMAGVGAGLSIEATRQLNAEAQGVSVRMMLAVTDDTIHVFSMPTLGGHPGKELKRFSRASTEVEVKHFGLSRKVNLSDSQSGDHLGLIGTTLHITPSAAGDRAVLAELSEMVAE